jgi:hypothetical protein
MVEKHPKCGVQISTPVERVPTLKRQNQFQRRGRHRPQLGKIGLQHVLLKHALGIEVRSVDRNR